MTIAQDFIKKLQDATGTERFPRKFWEDSSGHLGIPTFQDVLDKYAEYYKSLSPPQKEEMDKIFWEQVKAIGGTPIIEDSLDSELDCDVYFLFPKEKIAGSTEVPGTDKGYDLALMSTLPDSNKAKAENGIIYLSEDGQYVVRDPKGVVQEGSLNTGEIDLSQLQINLKSSNLKSAILKVTSNAAHTPKKDLYLQGDFHGYGSIGSRQELLERPDTGIMWRKNTMPRDSLVVYSYIEVEPSHRGKKPEPELPPFFEDGDGFTPRTTNTAIFPEIPQSGCSDEYSSHASPYFFNSSEKIARINSDPERAHIPGKPIDWLSLLNTETPSNTKNFVYHAALYSDKEGDLHRSVAPVTAQYHDDLFYSDKADSPYANFTRAIQVFKPASGQIDDIIVVNDGIPSLMTGCMDHFEKMVAEKKLSPNTALVFINPLPGLKETLSPKVAEAFNKDPSKDLSGMGVRLIDYRHGIDQYIKFIDEKLFPELKKEIGLPSEPNHSVMRGVSLSGTASIYIGSKRPDLFDAVIAQSPSSANRAILSEIPRSMLTGRNIYLSCGKFEHPDYAAANAFIKYAKEVSRKLGITLHTDAHGHQNIAWNEELEEALPALALQRTIDSAHVPAVSYACVLPDELPNKQGKTTFTPTSLAVGKKDATSAESKNSVDENTQFPASSLSKIAFTYLVLQLAKEPTIDFDLDTPLYDILGDEKFVYERFREKAVPPDIIGKYPEKATQITARHVLSHTTGLPNVEPNSTTLPTFDDKSKLGEGYSYSGEAILYLQKAIEAKTGKDLETLAEKYVFKPLHMNHSTFLRQPEDDTSIVKVHSALGVPTTINEDSPELNVANAAGSLVTTADDFSKLMVAWLENMDDPIIQQAFKPTSEKDSMTPGKRTCGLGWHIHKNKKDEVIAYQYGENFNTRSFIAINVNEKKGAVFFTNSKNGSSIANQIFNSPDLPPIGDLQDVYNTLKYSQSDAPGAQAATEATIAGKIAEEKGEVEEARRCFKEALKWTPRDESKQRCLEWFNEVHPSAIEKQTFTPLETFAGEYTNIYGDEVKMYLKGDSLIHEQYGHQTKLVQVSDTEFLPAKDQSFKISINGNGMSKLSITGDEYLLSKPPILKSQLEALHEKTDPASLEAAREVNQQYRGALEDLKVSEAASTSATEVDVAVEEHRAPSPFQVTPKPSGNE